MSIYIKPINTTLIIGGSYEDEFSNIDLWVSMGYCLTLKDNRNKLTKTIFKR